MRKTTGILQNTNHDFTMDKNQEFAAKAIIKTFSILFIILIFAIHILKYYKGILFITDTFFYFLIILSYLISIYLTKINIKSSIHLFITAFLVNLVYIEFFSKNNISINTVSTVIYLLPVSICIFLLSRPASIIFTTLFLFVYAARILLISNLTLLEDIIGFNFIALSVFTMLLVKNWMANLFNQKIQSLEDLNHTTTEILSQVVELKDGETSYHLLRVQEIVEEIIMALKKLPYYKSYLTKEYLKNIKMASTLHDIGKIGIPDYILQKPGKLTEEEFEFIKEHTVIGYNLLNNAKNKVANHDFYDLAISIARSHHERWDGTGYPDRLKKNETPLSARIMAVADVYDALVTRRPYKRAYSHEEAVEILKQGRGTQFDPQIIDIFIQIHEKIRIKMDSII